MTWSPIHRTARSLVKGKELPLAAAALFPCCVSHTHSPSTCGPRVGHPTLATNPSTSLPSRACWQTSTLIWRTSTRPGATSHCSIIPMSCGDNPFRSLTVICSVRTARVCTSWRFRALDWPAERRPDPVDNAGAATMALAFVLADRLTGLRLFSWVATLGVDSCDIVALIQQ